MSEMQRKPGFWDRLIGREAAEPPKPAADPAASRSEGTPDFTTATGADPVPAQARATQASPETPADEKLPPSFPAPTSSPSKAPSRRAPPRGSRSARRTRRFGRCRPEELVASPQ